MAQCIIVGVLQIRTYNDITSVNCCHQGYRRCTAIAYYNGVHNLCVYWVIFLNIIIFKLITSFYNNNKNTLPTSNLVISKTPYDLMFVKFRNNITHPLKHHQYSNRHLHQPQFPHRCKSQKYLKILKIPRGILSRTMILN